MQEIQTKQRVQVPRLAVSKRFGRYKKEERKEEREADVKRDRILEQLMDSWKAYGHDSTTGNVIDEPEHFYYLALRIIEDTKYTRDQIERFVGMMGVFQNESFFSEKAGMFLSALINSSDDDNFVVDTRNMKSMIWCLGYQNIKDIEVLGNMGHLVGRGMKKGSIDVDGDAGHWVGSGLKGGTISIKGSAGFGTGSLPFGKILLRDGYEIKFGGRYAGLGCHHLYEVDRMSGGTIIIGKNAGSDIGKGMSGGAIIIKGDVVKRKGKRKTGNLQDSDFIIVPHVKSSIGEGMKGGQIRIEGKIGKIGYVIGGKIYHRGKLIVDK